MFSARKAPKAFGDWAPNYPKRLPLQLLTYRNGVTVTVTVPDPLAALPRLPGSNNGASSRHGEEEEGQGSDRLGEEKEGRKGERVGKEKRLSPKGCS